MPFKQGQSGNPNGRPKVVAEVRELARQHTNAAVNTLVAMLKAKGERTRVAAAEALLDRGWGKSQLPVKLDAENPFIEVLREINARRIEEREAREQAGPVVAPDTRH